MNKLSDMVCIDVASTAYPLKMIGSTELQNKNALDYENDLYVKKYTDMICIDIVSIWELCPSKWLDVLQAGMIYRVRIALERMNVAFILINKHSDIDFVSALWHFPL